MRRVSAYKVVDKFMLDGRIHCFDTQCFRRKLSKMQWSLFMFGVIIVPNYKSTAMKHQVVHHAIVKGNI